MREWATRGLVVTHALSAVAEWAVITGILVHAFAWGEAPAVGIVSLCLFAPLLIGASLLGAAQNRWPIHTTRVIGLVVQTLAYTSAALAAGVGAPTPVVAPFVVMGLTAFMLVPPTTAALLPQMARSADGMVRSNLWVTYSDSASGLVGPLGAGLVIGFSGPTAVFGAAAGCAGIGLVATLWRASPYVRAVRAGSVAQPKRHLRRVMAEFGSHPWGRGVLYLSSARNLVFGAFDVLLVIVAIELLDMGDAGPGYLSAMVGAGALASTLVTAMVVRRARLRPSLMLAIMLIAVAAVVMGAQIERPVVFVALPLIGFAMALTDALSRALLIRSTDPRSLAPLHASLSFVGGVGQIVGSVIAQLMLALGDARLAFAVIGAVVLVLAGLTIRALRRADEHAEIPVVEMALLSGQPMMSALPSSGLERVARSAPTREFTPGELMVAEGEYVDGCYVIMEGEFEVTARGRSIGSLARGDVVGEVALLSRISPMASVAATTAGKALRIERRSFLFALTGFDIHESSETPDLAEARGRFRDVVAAQERLAGSTGSDRPDVWLGLSAAGRVLGDSSFTEVLARTARVAEETSNEVVLAEAAALATWPGAFFFIADNPDQAMIDLCEKALARLGSDDPMRVRVLATLASNLAFQSTLERRRDLICEAHELAAGHGDPALIGAVLNSEFISMWEPATLARRAEIGPKLATIGQQIRDPELEYFGEFLTAFCAAERRDFDGARGACIALRELAPESNNLYFEFLSERLLLSIDISQGRDGVQERIDELAERHGETYADTDGTWALQIGGLAYEAGTLGTMVPVLTEMLEGPHARTWRSALALAHVSANDPNAAAAIIADQEEVPRSYFWMAATQTQAEVVANLGMVERCGELFEELLPFRDQVGITASGSRIFGLVSRSLGELALALARYDDAVEFLEQAVADADSCRMEFEGVTSRRLLAQAYLAHGAFDRAMEIIDEALPSAIERGYAREISLMESFRSAEV